MVAPNKRPHPKVGSIFERTYKGKTYKMRVVKNDGAIAYDINGSAFRTPSAAGRFVTGGEVNGWVFWRIE